MPLKLTTEDREKRSAALSSLVAAIGLTAMKIVVGVLTGSLGILAEAAHSGLDLVAALMTYVAVRISGRPADSTHLYGHGKVENLSALAEALLLFITCGWIIWEAMRRLFFHQVEVEVTIWSFAVMATSIVIDVSRSRMLSHTAKKYNSQALEADALHFETDVWSSSVVILGLACVKLGEWAPSLGWLREGDAVAALGVSALVIWVCGDWAGEPWTPFSIRHPPVWKNASSPRCRPFPVCRTATTFACATQAPNCSSTCTCWWMAIKLSLRRMHLLKPSKA